MFEVRERRVGFVGKGVFRARTVRRFEIYKR